MTKITYFGSAIVYSIAIPNTSTNKDGAIKYIMNMRSKKGLNYVIDEGINKLKETNLFFGNISAIPTSISNQNLTV